MIALIKSKAQGWNSLQRWTNNTDVIDRDWHCENVAHIKMKWSEAQRFAPLDQKDGSDEDFGESGQWNRTGILVKHAKFCVNILVPLCVQPY